MNIKNLEYLQKGLKNIGFGDNLNAELEARIKEQPEAFQISFMGEFKRNGIVEKADYELDFTKSEKSDMYFLNKYRATLKGDDPSKDRSQTFYITKNYGVTAKEAYNLLSERSVNKDLKTKDGKEYNAWLQLDFSEKDKNENYKVKQFHSSYGYNLEATLERYPIKELGEEGERERLVKSLKKGNLHQVTFNTDGKNEMMFVAANPQYKSLHLYDAKMQRVFQGVDRQEGKVNEKQVEGATKSEKKESRKQDTNTDGEDSDTRKTKRRGVGI